MPRPVEGWVGLRALRRNLRVTCCGVRRLELVVDGNREPVDVVTRRSAAHRLGNTVHDLADVLRYKTRKSIVGVSDLSGTCGDNRTHATGDVRARASTRGGGGHRPEVYG